MGMQIGIYNPAVGTRYSGGTETFLREMIRELSISHDVTVFTGGGEVVPELRQSNANIVQFPWIDKTRPLATLGRKLTADQMLSAEVESLSLFAGSGFGRRINTDNLDVLSTHYYLDNILLSRTLEIPTLFRFPGIRRPSPRWKAMARLARPEVYISNSKTTGERIQNWLDIEVDGTIYAGVDTDRFSPSVSPAIDTEAFTALFVGRLDPGKGLHELVEAVARVHNQNKNIELLLVGDGILRSDLEAQAESQGVGDEVMFVGEVEHGEVPHYYASADVFCLMSEHEGFPVVNIEAMSSGLPVISTHIPAVEEQIVDREDGILVDTGDVEALAEELQRLASDVGYRERLGSAARKKAVTEFTWNVQVERMEELYEQAKQKS